MKYVLKNTFVVIIVCIILGSLIYAFNKPSYEQVETRILAGKNGVILLENLGKDSTTFKMKFNGIRLSSDEDIIDYINSMESEYTNEPFYRKTWRFVRDFRYHFDPYTGQPWQHCPSLFFNSIGFGLCDDSAALFASIVKEAGWDTRIWGLNGHVVAEVLVNGRWEMYDPTFQVYYYNRQNKVAGVEELADDPALITEPIQPILDLNAPAYSQVVEIYGTKEDNETNSKITNWYLTYPDENLQFAIPPGGKLYFPAVFSPDLKNLNGNLVPLFSNMKLALPPGWTGEIDIPLVIQTIEGNGKISIEGQSFDIRSSNLKEFLNDRTELKHHVKIESNNGDIEIIYLLNPILFTMKSINLIAIEGNNIDTLKSTLVSPQEGASIPASILWILTGSLVLAFFITGIVRKYAIRNNILDIPNERSSHKSIIPRGGGLAIVISFYLGLTALLLCGFVSLELTMALAGGIGVAIIGWIDDKRNLSVSLRITVHFAAALWALYWLNGLPFLTLGSKTIHLGAAGVLPGLLLIIWITNLYNFMDGIDGLAGTEALIVSGGAGIISLALGSFNFAIVCFLITVVSASFLYWNWSPAKIFMGDVGSGFMGFVFAVVIIASENAGALPLAGWLMLLAVFLIDATATLLKRIANKEKWYEAHRTHVYQLAVQAGYSHQQVSLIIAVINILLTAVTFILVQDTKWMLIIWGFVISALTFVHSVLRRKFNEILLRESEQSAILFKQAAAGQDSKYID
mgnify:CR=1 FL=1